MSIEIYYSNPDSNVRLYKKKFNYYSKKLYINKQSNNSYKTILIVLDLFL